MKLTAAICTRNRPELLARYLPSVLAYAYRPREILVVDQSDDDRTCDVVLSLGAGAAIMGRSRTDDGRVRPTSVEQPRRTRPTGASDSGAPRTDGA